MRNWKTGRRWCQLFATVIFLTLLGDAASAATFIDCDFNSPPSSESEGGRYTCSVGSMSLRFGSNLSGQVFDHVTTEGWRNTGAAKFYTHVAAQSFNNSYRQLDPSSFSSNTQQNLRYLIKLSTGVTAQLGGKWHLSDAAGGWRTWYSISDRGCGIGRYGPEVAFNNTSYVVHGGGEAGAGCGYQWCANPSTWWDRTLATCQVAQRNKFQYQNYENQWICIELERHSNGNYKVYVWTQDGAFSGLYYQLATEI